MSFLTNPKHPHEHQDPRPRLPETLIGKTLVTITGQSTFTFFKRSGAKTLTGETEVWFRAQPGDWGNRVTAVENFNDSVFHVSTDGDGSFELFSK